MVTIFDVGIIVSSIYVLYNILREKSKARDNKIKIGMLVFFFLIILKLIFG